MQLIEHSTESTDISLNDYVDIIQQATDTYMVCPDICGLIAQFIFTKKCKLYSINCEPFVCPQRKFSDAFALTYIGYLNTKINWNDYPIVRGDIIIIILKTIEIETAAMFDGKILINPRELIDENSLSENLNHKIFLPKEFNMLDEFYPCHWLINHITMYIHIDLIDHIEEIKSNISMIYLKNTPELDRIEWSYFTYNEKITILYAIIDKDTSPPMLNNMVHLYISSKNIYHMNFRLHPEILPILEEHTSIDINYFICLYDKSVHMCEVP